MFTELQRFAESLKGLRKEKGLSQSELAESAGVPLKMIVNCEKGRNYRGVENILKLARYFKVTTQRLLCGE